MNRYISLLVLALLVASLGAPLVDLFVAQAQTDRVITYNVILTPGGELGFVIERYGSVLPAGPVFYFFLSTDAATNIKPTDIRIGSIENQTFAAGGNFYVAGTLLVTKKDVPTGDYYLKVSTSDVAGAPAVVSGKKIRYVTNATTIKSTLIVLNDRTKAPADRFAFFENPAFEVANRIQVILNLSGLPRAVIEHADRFNVTLSHAGQVLRVSAGFATPPTVHLNEFLYEPDLRTSKDSAVGLVSLSGRIGNFSLCCYTEGITLKGIPFASQSFTVVATLYGGMVNISGTTTMPVYPVRLGVVQSRVNTTVSLLLPNASIVSVDKIRLFPSVGVRFVKNADSSPSRFGINDSKRLNVGDDAVLHFRNFNTTATTARSFQAHFFALEGGTYVNRNLSPGEVKQVNISNIIGNGTAVYMIVPNPYGGRIVQVTVNATGTLFAMTNITEIVAHRVRPIFEAKGIDSSTLQPTVDPPRYVPGEYIVVRGLGYLDTGLRLTLTNRTVSYPVRLVDHMYFPNGTYVAIYQIRQDALINDYGRLNVTLLTTCPNCHTLHNVQARYDVNPVVLIDPSPKVLGVTNTTPLVTIATDVDKYPHPATWEDLSKRVFSLLAYGFPQGAARFNVTMSGTITPYLTNVAASGRGVLNLTAQPVPELPMSHYRVSVASGATSATSSLDNEIRIRPTVAVLDPADNVFKKRIFIPTPLNITLRGYGYVGNADVYADIPTLGLANIDVSVGPAANPARARTNEFGTFLAGWIDLRALSPGPGLHVIRVRAGVASDEVRIIIGEVPPLQLKLAVAPTQFADMPVGVYGIVTFGGEIARTDQVMGIAYRIMLTRAVPTFTHSFALVAPRAIYPGMAIYFAQFVPTELFGETVKGKEVAVLGNVTARFAPGAPISRAADIVVFEVPAKTIAEELSAVVAGLSDLRAMLAAMSAQLNATASTVMSIAGEVSAVRSELNATASTVMSIAGEVSAVRSDVAAVRTLLVTVDSKVSAVDAKVSNVLTAVIALSSANDQVLARLASLNATVRSGIATVRTDIAGLADMLRAVNGSIARIVREEGSTVRAAIVSGRDAIIGVVRANASALAELVRQANTNVVNVHRDLRALVDAVAAFRGETVTRLDAVSTAITGVRDEVTRARDAVMTEVRGVVTEVRNVGSAVNTVSTKVDGVRTVVDGIRTAVEGVAKKSDVVEAVKDLAKKSDVDAVKSEVKSAGDSAATSSRNWGLINAVLIIVAIALIAYSAFFSQKK